MQLQLKQEVGIFQASIVEAFNKLSEQQKSLQEQINQPSATFVNLPRIQLMDQTTESRPKPSTSSLDFSKNSRAEEVDGS